MPHNVFVMATDTVRIEKLDVGYRRKGGCRVVAGNMNAVVYGGELTCLIGANGVGKSTLLRTLSGFQPKLAGHIYIKGKEMGAYSRRQLAQIVSVVLTGRPEVDNLTVYELVALGRNPYTGFWGSLAQEDRLVVDNSLSMTGISRLAKRMVHTLSDGERQKMMIAKALAQQTDVIFLDEPTAFLDYQSKVEMMQLLHVLAGRTGKTIFMSTHDVELALQIADRLWLMTDGGKLCMGAPGALAESGALSDFIDRPGIRFDASAMSIRVE